MGQADRRKQEVEIRRQDIIDAAEKIFFAKGYENASMDEVAKEAEFSKRTVYVYFSGKEQIYYEIMIRGYRLLLAMTEQSLAQCNPQTALDELRSIFLAFFEFSEKHPDYFRAIMEYETKDASQQTGIEDESKAECYRLGEQIFACLSRALKRGVAEGSLRSGLDTEKSALILWACTIGVFNTGGKKGEYLKNYHGIEPRDFVTGFFDFIVQFICRNGEGDQ